MHERGVRDDRCELLFVMMALLMAVAGQNPRAAQRGAMTMLDTWSRQDAVKSVQMMR
jgi:hypothetical protein